ncbi:RusA family crossover junction endodeoxyribonuclease [Acinetobacter indicus]|uniref:RusA family crossover junction endodeoxyribonuclease n=1 Tax=Acinetobacter indicus TaxID=756892 RepID=UPI002574B492|nr:RusA family crossover junction endodeoxyribonuclease [Acinetobacter indicus]MDM1330024.1 RusA family crossover junction endodeoxyribonuclease [Acinetobacter indicus]
MNLRWSENQLEVHLNRHKLRKDLATAQFKTENDAKVQDAQKNATQATTAQNTTHQEKTIVDCEIAAIPPSVNHYWEKSGRGFKLSNKARDFHDVVSILVPQLNTAARLKLDVTFHFPNRLRRDIDNYLKATIDSLVKCGLCVDDEQFDELIVRRGEVVRGGLIKIKVLEI